MKVLVTGGTGFTGHNLSKTLLAEGVGVRLILGRTRKLPSTLVLSWG
jgi:nucleoside-diphosphate-sugar epimerase